MLQGVKAETRKVTNMFKMAEGLQKPDEFYERLCEAFRMYTAFDSEAQENRYMVNQTFMAQSYTDICCKLQSREGFAGMNSTQLLEVTN